MWDENFKRLGGKTTALEGGIWGKQLLQEHKFRIRLIVLTKTI